MSTMTSPRPSLSITSPTPSSSSRPSTSTSRTASPARHPQQAPSTRRNRTALRDYYNLNSTALSTTSDPTESITNNDSQNPSAKPHALQGDAQNSILSELDAPNFDPEAWVSNKLAEESLEGLLKCEASLIGEIRGLDGERKALVYDNYSKLIGATETIGKMRMNMDPLTPATRSLEESVGRIATMAEGIVGPAKAHASHEKEDGISQSSSRTDKQGQVATVRWVLAAPERFKSLQDSGQQNEAANEWKEIKDILTKWKDVKGVGEVKEQCEKIMQR